MGIPGQAAAPLQLGQVCCVLPEDTLPRTHSTSQPSQMLLHCCRTRSRPPDPERSNTCTCSFCKLDGMRWPTKSMQAGFAIFWNQYVPEEGFQNWSKSIFHTGIYNYSLWFSFSDLSQNFRVFDFCPIRSILALISVFYGFTTNVLYHF